MGNYEQLKQAVSNVIKSNGTQAITGQVLQNTLLTMINSLGGNYQFVGIASTSTNPGTPDQNVFYLAGEGTYTNFSNLTIDAGQLGVLKWNGTWSKQVLEIGSGGGNMILNWNTDISTTRKQVLQKYRKPGIQISYKEPEKGWINEQYIGTSISDSEWIKDTNWEKIVNETELKNLESKVDENDDILDNKINKTALRETKFSRINSSEIYESVNVVSNGRVDSSSVNDFILFDTKYINVNAVLSGQSVYITFTEKPTKVTAGTFLKNFTYNKVIDGTLKIDETIKYIGINSSKSLPQEEVLIEDISGENNIKEKYIYGYRNINGENTEFIPASVSQITKTEMFSVESGKTYIVDKIAPVGMSKFVGIYKNSVSDDNLVFSYNIDKVRVVIPSDGANYKLIIAIGNGGVSVGQNLKVYNIEDYNNPMANYLLTSDFISKSNDYYDLRKRFVNLIKGSNQFIDYDFENNDPIAWDGRELPPSFLTGNIPFIISLGGGVPGGSGGLYTLQDDGDGRYIFFTYDATQRGGYIGFPEKYLNNYNSNDTYIIGLLVYVNSSSQMALFGNNMIETNKWVWVEDEITYKYDNYIKYDFKLGRIGDTVKMKHFCLKDTTKDGAFVGFEVNESTYLKTIITSSDGASNLFANKNLVTIGDSLFLELAGNNMPKSISSKLKCNLLANFTKGGVGTIGTDNECGMMRARKIEDIKDDIDIIIYENVNDGGNGGSIEDEGFMLTQQVNVNVPQDKEAETYWEESFNEIVAGVTPKVGTMIRLAKGSEGFYIEVIGTATSQGNISFSVGEMQVNIQVSIGDTAEKIMEQIDTYPFADEGYEKDNSSSTSTKCVYINIGQSETVVPTISNNVQGVTVNSAKIGGYSYEPKIFYSHDVSLWNDKSYWKDSISLYAQYKGLIEYFCTTCPKAWIFLMAGSRYYIAYSPEHTSGAFSSWEPPKRADGSYDIDKFQKDGASYIRYDKYIAGIVREVCEYMHVNCLDMPRYDCINVYNASYYYQSCDVHIQYKKTGMDRWVDTIYRQMIGKG